MSGTMSLTDLMADFKASLHDAANIFIAANDGDFSRMLNVAALDMARVRPRTLVGSAVLVADTDSYAAPSDLVAYKTDLWSAQRLPQPWEPNYPGPLPRVQLLEDGGVKKLVFTPAPTALQITVLGSAFRYYYFAAHVIDATAANTSIRAGDRNLLLLRAQAEAMREMALRNIAKPVQLRDGISQSPKNGTPAALYGALMDEFERMAA